MPFNRRTSEIMVSNSWLATPIVMHPGQRVTIWRATMHGLPIPMQVARSMSRGRETGGDFRSGKICDSQAEKRHFRENRGDVSRWHYLRYMVRRNRRVDGYEWLAGHSKNHGARLVPTDCAVRRRSAGGTQSGGLKEERATQKQYNANVAVTRTRSTLLRTSLVSSSAKAARI